MPRFRLPFVERREVGRSQGSATTPSKIKNYLGATKLRLQTIVESNYKNSNQFGFDIDCNKIQTLYRVRNNIRRGQIVRRVRSKTSLSLSVKHGLWPVWSNVSDYVVRLININFFCAFIN